LVFGAGFGYVVSFNGGRRIRFTLFFFCSTVSHSSQFFTLTVLTFSAVRFLGTWESGGGGGVFWVGFVLFLGFFLVFLFFGVFWELWVVFGVGVG